MKVRITYADILEIAGKRKTAYISEEHEIDQFFADYPHLQRRLCMGETVVAQIDPYIYLKNR